VFDGVVERVGAQDETVFVKTDVTKGQRVAHTYRIKIGSGRPVGRKRIVMPVEHDDGMRSKYRLHGEGLGRGDADGEKALPIATNDSPAGAKLFQDASRKLNDFNRGL
jgi:hypothetical protein